MFGRVSAAYDSLAGDPCCGQQIVGSTDAAAGLDQQSRLRHRYCMVSEDDVRRIALSLPAATERPCYGTPGFRVQDRLFARIHDQPDVLVIWRDSIEDRTALLAADPDKFFTTPHYDGHPSVLVRLAAIDDAELEELLIEAWEARASARLRAQSPGR